MKSPIVSRGKIAVQAARDKLNRIHKSQEDYEQKKRDLELEMTKETEKLDKMVKAIKEDNISSLAAIEVENNGSGAIKRHLSPDKKRNVRTDNATLGLASASKDAPALNGIRVIGSYIIPSGLRVSDWCFNGSIYSTPPGNFSLY
jgi:hypothetical protein